MGSKSLFLKIAQQLAGVACVAFIFAGPAAAVEDSTRVTLHFDQTPISTVLKMLAAQSHLNLVVPATVEGDVSLSLDNVSLEAALNAILLSSGFSYYLNQEIIIVKPADQRLTGELIPRIYGLKHIEAAAAEAAIKPLLSLNGTITPLAATPETDEALEAATRLVVTDYPVVQELIGRLLTEIDLPRRQISIEVKIIETNLNDDERLGINWPQSVSASAGGIPTPGASSTSSSTTGSEAAVLPLDDGHWQLGYLSVDQLDLVLEFLSQRSDSKLLSNPRLTTMEGKTASIDVQTVYPIQTINRFSEGAVIQDIVTFQDEEVGISLKVTPRIADDSTIIMQVHPVVEEIIGYAGSEDNQKPITSQRSIETQVAVKNNETLALGGLLKETTIETKNKVLFLGQIPILGELFTHTVTEKKTTDLLILITPRILE